jgi:hypothetical protein
VNRKGKTIDANHQLAKPFIEKPKTTVIKNIRNTLFTQRFEDYHKNQVWAQISPIFLWQKGLCI